MDKEKAINLAMKLANDDLKNTRLKYEFDESKEVYKIQEFWVIPFKDYIFPYERCAMKAFLLNSQTAELFHIPELPILKTISKIRLGLYYDAVDITILSIRDLEKTIRMLDRLDMRYVTPEYEYGTLWVVPVKFSTKEIEERLKFLPATFYNQEINKGSFTISGYLFNDAFGMKLEKSKSIYQGSRIKGELHDHYNLIDQLEEK